jgi:hypothetical protein
VVVHAGDQELTENVTLKAKTDTVLKVVRKGDRFVIEQEQGKAREPIQQVASAHGPGLERSALEIRGRGTKRVSEN